MSDEPPNVIFTVKELLQRLDERLSAVDQKLDIRLAQFEDRITHIERERAANAYLLDEHKQMKADVASLKTFRARFLPTTVIVALVALIALLVDIYFRAFG